MKNRISSYCKKFVSFILFIYRFRKGPVRLRAFYALLSFLAMLIGGWGIGFYLDSTGRWVFQVSYSIVGWCEIVLAVIGLVAFSILLYFDNKSEFDKSISGQLDRIEKDTFAIQERQKAELLLPFYRFRQFDSLYNRHDVSKFEDTEELCEKRSLITNSGIRSIRILALSGSGKTFQILKAFQESGKVIVSSKISVID